MSSLWVKAVDELPDEHKHGIDFTNSEKIDILKDLREKAENSRDRFLASRWKFTRRSGETVIMRDLFDKFVRWVDMFKQIGDVAVQYDPIHASLPWAGVRLVLQIVVNDTNKLESVMEDLTWISELICRYTLVEALYIYDASPAHKELENAVVKLYASILSHLSYITKYFGQGSAKRLIKSTGSNHTFESSLDNIRKLEQRVEEWRSLAESNDHMKRNIKLEDLLNTMNQPLKRIDQSLETVVDNLERSKRIAILQWLSSEPYLGHHKQIKEGLLKDTGKWLLDDPVFKKWRGDSASSILWLHGIAGSGKSKLTSIVLDHAMNNFQARNSPHPVFFYCSRNPAEPTRSNPRAILASIARQLSATAPGKPLLKPTVEMYEKEEDQGFASGPPEMKEICELIMQLVEVYPQTTIVIDAIDECDPQKRGDLLEFLETILQNASSLVKVFVSSRNDQDVVYKLKSYPNLQIDSQSNGEDIARFVEYEVERLIQQKKLVRDSQSPDQLKKLIVSETVKGAHEMFRWASMQLQYLCLLPLDDDIKNAVGRLPPDLRTLYNELYNILSATPGKLRATIFKNALHWVLSAQTKLEPEEFLTAVSLIPTEEERVLVSQEQILEICNNFIVYDSQLHTFRFAHLSVREFLEGRPEFSVPLSNSILAETFLWTLLCTNPSPAIQKLFHELNWITKIEISVILELKGYTDLFWAQHCRLAGDMRNSGPLQAALQYLFVKENDHQPTSFSYEEDQRSDALTNHNRRPKSTIALWSSRIDKIVRWWVYPDGSPLADQRRVVILDEIEIRDQRRAHDPYVWKRLTSCTSSEHFPFSTRAFVICVHDLEELGRELLVGEALTRPCYNYQRETIFSVARQHRSCRIMSHFARQTEFSVTFATDMLGFASEKYSTDVAKVLSQHWKTDTESRKYLLMRAMTACSYEGAKEFLNSWEDIPITQEMVEKAASNRFFDSKWITLLQQRGTELEVTQKMILNAIQYNRDTTGAVKSLLKHAKANVNVTQEMIAQAVEHRPWSIDLVEFLLEEGGEEVKVTQELVIDAITHPNSSIQLVRFLLDPNRTDIRVTQLMVETALNRSRNIEIINFLLTQGRETVIVTQGMIETAARISDMPVEVVNILLNKRTNNIVITEETVEAIRAREKSSTLMKSFLSKKRRDLPIAKPVVTAIVRYLDMEIIEILLDEFGVRAVVTTENIGVFVQRGLDKQDMLMELFKKRAEVLDVLIQAASGIREARRPAKMNFRIESFGANRCRLKFVDPRCIWHWFVRNENGWKLRGT